MLDERLLDCPFCGEIDPLITNPPVGDDTIECEMCGVKMTGITLAVVIAKWNTRNVDGFVIKDELKVDPKTGSISPIT